MNDDDCDCTLCRQRAGAQTAPVAIAHEDPRPCEGDCKHCVAVGRVAELESALDAALQSYRESQVLLAQARQELMLCQSELHVTDVRLSEARRRMREVSR